MYNSIIISTLLISLERTAGIKTRGHKRWQAKPGKTRHGLVELSYMRLKTSLIQIHPYSENATKPTVIKQPKTIKYPQI